MVSMETVWSRFSNYHLQFDACMQQRVDVVKPWNRARFDFLTLKFVIWENNNNEMGLDIFIPESFIKFRTKVIRDTLIYSSILRIFLYFRSILSYFFEYVFSESGFSEAESGFRSMPYPRARAICWQNYFDTKHSSSCIVIFFFSCCVNCHGHLP